MKRCSSKLRRARPLLGTFVEIEVAGLPAAQAGEAIEAGFSAIAQVQAEMSFHDPASALSQINREAFAGPVALSPSLFAVLEMAADLHRCSAGLFDVTIAPWLERRGFLPARSEGGAQERAFDELPGFTSVGLSPDRTIRFHHRSVRIDLGGIAKGFAVDQAIGALQRAGVEQGLVNAGGDLRVFGPEAVPVSIRHPNDPSACLATIALRDRAMATSSHSFADRLVANARFGPIVDPSSGQSATQVATATVQAPTAMLADALTKVLMLDPERALPLLTHFQADALFVAIDGRASSSPGWNATFEFSS